MRDNWARWQALGWIQPVDEMMGRYLFKWMERFGDPHAAVMASLAIVLSRASTFGHACVPLDGPWPEDIRMMREYFPKSEQLLIIVQSCGWVEDDTKPHELQDAPLWLSSGRKLYLRRFAMYEQSIATWFRRQSERHIACDAEHASRVLDALFLSAAQQTGKYNIDWQRVAVSIALRFPLVVLAGGPGTGKTTTVIKLLAAFQALSVTPLNIVVAAPTGKAAARLTASMLHQRDKLSIDQAVKAVIPQSTHTIHRLLEWSPTRQRFGRNQDAPLSADVVVVDEASMLDLYMAQALIKSLKPEARLILLGDSNQLPAVESGAVFQHLGALAMKQPSQAYVDWLQATESVPGSVDVHDLEGRVGTMAVTLRDSYRFAASGELGAVAQAVLEGNGSKAFDCVERSQWFVARPDMLQVAIRKWDRILQQATVGEAMETFQKFRLLVASRKTVVQLNAALHAHFNPCLDQHYQGQPIMVIVNDYRRMIFNGDIGMIWPDHAGHLVAWFWVEGKLQSFNLQGLPAWETCYAMTVHKSQGSEFDEVGIVFPEGDGGTLTRQWLYTAITRAKSKVLFTHSVEHFMRATESVTVRETDFSTFLPELAVSAGVVN